MWLGEPRSTNPLSLSHPKIDKLACRGLSVGILAKGEITLRDAYCLHICFFTQSFYHICVGMSIGFSKRKVYSFSLVNLTTPF